VGLVVALPLVMGGLPGSALVKSDQPESLLAGAQGATAIAPISLPRMGRMQAEQQAFGSAGPGVYRMTPERRALLNTIRFAEGTWTDGRGDGYRMLYGGGQFRDMARHPDFVVTSGYSSAAAGAYQFLPATWNEAARRLRLPDFQPASQDQAALYLMEKRGALARFDRHGLSHDVLALLAQEWASLPTLHGASYYGQPVKGVEELRRFYSEDLARQRTKMV
jgi:lysozyme